MTARRQISIDAGSATRFLRESPEVFVRHLGAKLRRGAEEVSIEAKGQAPKAFSTLANSMRVIQLGPLHFRVAPGVGYAALVHEGTGGYAHSGVQALHGGGRRFPIDTILSWIRVKGIQPKDPGMSQEDLAFVIRRSILRKGTPANPFLDRAVDAKEDRVRELADQGIQAALKELGAQA